MQGAFYTDEYRNVFLENGYSKEEIDRKVEETFQAMFYGPEDVRIYHPAGPDMGYIEDTGNHDARTEGMSYGMMMCVQMDKKEEFDRIWKWAKTYMYIRRERRILCLVLSDRWDEERIRPGAGWGRVFCNGAVLCRKPVGKRRGNL